MSHPLALRPTSRLPELKRLSPRERRASLVAHRWLSPSDQEWLEAGRGFGEAVADRMSEQVIGVHGLPLSVATNFIIDGLERLVPMAIEEPSVVAAASFAAKLVREGGGFETESDEPITTTQIQLTSVPNPTEATAAILDARDRVLAEANALIPRMVERGGGAVGLEVRILASHMLCVYLHVDCRDAMGANVVNQVAELIAPRLAALSGGRVGLRILTNLADQRKVTVRARVPLTALAGPGATGAEAVRDGVIEAQAFAELDPYRAATHNKGIMNGVDAVLVACGNDWRAAEAAAHAYAAREGRYAPLTRWRQGDDGALEGELVMPMPASTVGGAARCHPGVQLALRLAGAKGALDLGALAASAGLAANLAALRALSTEGICRGHMALHDRASDVVGPAARRHAR